MRPLFRINCLGKVGARDLRFRGDVLRRGRSRLVGRQLDHGSECVLDGLREHQIYLIYQSAHQRLV